MATFAQDLRFGVRMLLARPGFTAAAVLSLALGIGANTTIFSLIGATLFSTLPYPDPDRLVVLWTSNVERPTMRGSVRAANYLAWKEHSRSFEAIGASYNFPSNLGASQDGMPAERVQGRRFTASMWEVLGVRPHLGRVFTADEDRIGDPAPVIVLSYGFWQRRFGGDPRVIGTSVRLDGIDSDIIGVMPEGFDFAATETAIWTPAGFSPQQVASAGPFLMVVGRLRDGVSLDQAQTESATMARGVAEQSSDGDPNVTIALQDLHGALFTGVDRPLLVLQGTVAFVLLIACANIAGLLLARANARRTEMAVRGSLGAGRWRIVRQLLTESLLLALAGGVVGCALAWVGLRLLIPAIPPDLIGLAQAGLDGRVLLATAVLSVVTGIVFGLVPALQTSRVELATALKESGRGVEASGGQKFRSALVAVQIGLALMLLIGAGLMANSFLKVLNNELGADPTNLLTFEFRFPQNELMTPVGSYRGVGLWEISPATGLTLDRLWERLQVIPGVTSAAGISRAPLSGGAMGMSYTVHGDTTTAGTQGAAFFAITPRYFETMRIPVLQGRDVAPQDTATMPLVVVVNKALADQVWGGESAIGRTITLDFVPDEQPREVVGVVANSVIGRFQRQPTPTIYVPHLQLQDRWQGPAWDYRAVMAFVMRSAGDPMALAPAVRAAVAEIDPGKPAANMRTVEQYLGEQARGLELYALLLGIFGLAAGLLAAIGIYGVMAYAVAQRTREIGIRMALGASGSRVVRLVLLHALVLVGIGIVLGLAGAMSLTRVLASELYEVSPTDPFTFAVVTSGVILVALLACVVPMHRAIRVEPTVALRHE